MITVSYVSGHGRRMTREVTVHSRSTDAVHTAGRDGIYRILMKSGTVTNGEGRYLGHDWELKEVPVHT